MAGTKSRRKGIRGERDAANALQQALGIVARRGRQFCGTPESPDVAVDSCLHVEVKRAERLNAYAAMDQAARDAGSENVPLVLYRRNRREWLVIVQLERMRRLIEILGQRSDTA